MCATNLSRAGTEALRPQNPESRGLPQGPHYPARQFRRHSFSWLGIRPRDDVKVRQRLRSIRAVRKLRRGSGPFGGRSALRSGTSSYNRPFCIAMVVLGPRLVRAMAVVSVLAAPHYIVQQVQNVPVLPMHIKGGGTLPSQPHHCRNETAAPPAFRSKTSRRASCSAWRSTPMFQVGAAATGGTR